MRFEEHLKVWGASFGSFTVNLDGLDLNYSSWGHRCNMGMKKNPLSFEFYIALPKLGMLPPYSISMVFTLPL